MAFPFAASLLAGLGLIILPWASSPRAEPAPVPADQVDLSLSPECRVPGSQLYTLAPLRAVKTALKEDRAVRVLTLGSGSVSGFLSPFQSYPEQLQGELERRFKGVEVEVVDRGLPGEIADGAGDRIQAVTAEVGPDLVVWQVGTNDALARVDLARFAEALDQTVQWLKSHDIDVVLVDPQYNHSMISDEHYQGVIKAIGAAARRNGVPLVLRHSAMKYLSGQGPLHKGKPSGFRLSSLGHRCIAEHVTRAITFALLVDEGGGGASGAAAAPEAGSRP